MDVRQQLNHEWHQLAWTHVEWDNTSTLPTASAWLHAIRTNPDVILLRLVTLAQQGEQLAGRVVVQALLPKLILMARHDTHAELGDYISAMWLQIRDYPVQNRPRKIAANLVLDTRKQVHRDRNPPPRTPTPADTSPQLTADVVLQRARHLHLISDDTATVLASVYRDGLSGEQAARQHGITPMAVRKRCSRAVTRMAAHRHLLAA